MEIGLRRVFVLGLLIGVVLNALGWVGNGVLLRNEWAQAVPDNPRYGMTGWPRFGIEALSLVSDFVLAFGLVWLYAAIQPRFGPGLGTAAMAAGLLWIVGVATPYVGMVKVGFLPVHLAVAACAIALVSFVPAAWLTARLYREPPG